MTEKLALGQCEATHPAMRAYGNVSYPLTPRRDAESRSLPPNLRAARRSRPPRHPHPLVHSAQSPLDRPPGVYRASSRTALVAQTHSREGRGPGGAEESAEEHGQQGGKRGEEVGKDGPREQELASADRLAREAQAGNAPGQWEGVRGVEPQLLMRNRWTRISSPRSPSSAISRGSESTWPLGTGPVRRRARRPLTRLLQDC
jgi:hypothetical protein